LTFRASVTRSESSSRIGVRSAIPGWPPALVTRLALAPWAVRRAWSARRPATISLSRVVLARLASWLTGVSGLAPGCGSSDTAITSHSRDADSPQRLAFPGVRTPPARVNRLGHDRARCSGEGGGERSE